jgi:hypothetical protein
MTGERGFRRLLRIRPLQSDVDLELQFHIESPPRTCGDKA